MRFKAERIYSTMKKQRFIPYEKLGKRQKRAEDAKRRTAWTLAARREQKALQQKEIPVPL